MSAFLYALAGIAVGGLITWFASWYYYKRAGDDLRKPLGVIVKLLQQPNSHLEVQWDANGNVTGILVRLAVDSTIGPLSTFGTATATNSATIGGAMGSLSSSATITAATERKPLRKSR